MTVSSNHHVVIVGGGFGGPYAARQLGRAGVKVTLIDRRNFHLFQPLLYQVATGGLSPGDVSAPLRSILKRHKETHVLVGDVESIDCSSREVLLSDARRVPYDSIIVAAGMRYHYFGKDWSDVTGSPKTIEDAFDSRQAEVLLVERTERVLPPYPETLSRRARASLEALGVQVRTSAMVQNIDERGVVIEQDGKTESIPSRTVLWAAGMKATSLANELAEAMGAEQDRQGRLVVDEHLHPAGRPEIFIVGDMAHRQQDGAPLPGIAPVAMQQGRYVADEIRRRLRGKGTEPFRYFDKEQMTVIGRDAAVCDLKGLCFGGWFAWITWLLVHIAFLIKFDNKLRVLAEWAWSYFTRKCGARLITGDD